MSRSRPINGAASRRLSALTLWRNARAGFDPAKALSLLERGVVRVGMALSEEASAVRKLFERYENLPASLADACLIRLSELYDDSRVMTLDCDFHVYRRHGRKTIALVRPD
jgi:predicted nucleic acid-binding protein